MVFCLRRQRLTGRGLLLQMSHVTFALTTTDIGEGETIVIALQITTVGPCTVAVRKNVTVTANQRVHKGCGRRH